MQHKRHRNPKYLVKLLSVLPCKPVIAYDGPSETYSGQLPVELDCRVQSLIHVAA